MSDFNDSVTVRKRIKMFTKPNNWENLKISEVAIF